MTATRPNTLDDIADIYVFALLPMGARAQDHGRDEVVQITERIAEEYTGAFIRLVSGRRFTNAVQDHVRSRFGSVVRFWDGDHLRGLIDDSYPDYWRVGSDTYKKFAQRALRRFRSDYAATAVQLRGEADQALFEGSLLPVLLERVTRPDGKTVMRASKTEHALERSGLSFIAGEAGSGKSTLLRLLAKRTIERDTQRYPVLLRFRDFENDFDVVDAVHRYFDDQEFEDLEIDADRVLEEGRALLLIDALDEVATLEGKEQALDAVGDFAEAFPDIQVVCTSRPSDRLIERGRDGDFSYFQTAPLRPEQVQRFITDYFNDDPKKGSGLIKSLQDSFLLDKLPCTPLTLTLVAAIFENSPYPEVPATVSSLYERFINLLTGRLTASSTAEVTDADVHLDALVRLALTLHTQRLHAISRTEYDAAIDAFVKERVGRSVSGFSAALLERSGLLFTDDDDRVQFKHLSFQEYLTATAFHQHDDLTELPFVEHFADPWWQDVAVFYGGAKRRAPQLIRDVLARGIPDDAIAQILAVGGLGRLLQAAHGTPVGVRAEAAGLSADLVAQVVQKLEDHDNPRYRLFQDLPKRDIITLLRWYFSLSFRSQTLIAPLELAFTDALDRFVELPTSGDADESGVDVAELQLFLLAATLASRGMEQTGPVRDLAAHSRSNDLALLAAEADYADSELEYVFDEPDEGTRKALRKAQRKLTGRMKSIRSGGPLPSLDAPIRPRTDTDDPTGND